MNQLNNKLIFIAIFIAIVLEIAVATRCRDGVGLSKCLQNCHSPDVGGFCFRSCLETYC